MAIHLTLVDDASEAEHAAMLKAFDWALDVLGILDEERDMLTRAPRGANASDRSAAFESEARMRWIVSIADDARALLADEDAVREWVRSPNPGLWTEGSCPVPTTPLRIMIDQDDGVRAIARQLSAERLRRFPRGWLC
ncbi:hypothetical protein KX816_04525 [Sphingosinicellaceae bacterium]|nr:hypothetical protein KX816_04525 [Sphingosinicellaceae bacterium]